ncbi:hypothetical protein ALQ08_04393 [Pseudomonas syringae pv. delphinii]|uniref:Uncharacterized protein n=1 Tax=Pseudomonas syringae pv. delphinii TaxID=192088 RepID=A0A0P9Q817_9PSED|nr:Uncharacterized protein ALO72_04075 [Pseudomonas syringae pv. delphinii]RMP15877.1 hypothetical protein ALQ28_04821 [Pseudomonas syringae pv. delphinii]RMP24270.1 hypothetical protein ALQ27_03968 [Pseudomonas syringae pv. delphinii]RMQ17304.1 hypothetical protein ALQ08_04393 [Pseudomonas syringae pv. delphinii]
MSHRVLQFSVTKQSFGLLKGFFAYFRALRKKLPKSPQSLFFTFTFER